MAGPWGAPAESAETLAREMIAEVGRAPAFGYMLRMIFGAGSWRRMKRSVKLATAVLFVRA
jgi:hypothetical protein